MLLSVCFFCMFHLFYQMKYFVNLLLVFEVLALSIYILCVCLSMLSASSVSVYTCVVILCFAVCEAVMGLSLLVGFSRFGGKSRVKPFSFLGY